MKAYIHQSGPHGCRKNCLCCKQEVEEAMRKFLARVSNSAKVKAPYGGWLYAISDETMAGIDALLFAGGK